MTPEAEVYIEGNYLFIKHPDKNLMSNLCHGAPRQSYFDKHRNAWKFSYDLDNVEFLFIGLDNPRPGFACLEEIYRDIYKSELLDPDVDGWLIVDQHEYKTPPMYKKQEEEFVKGILFRSWAFFWVQGLGKSWVTINTMLTHNAGDILIITPKNGIYSWSHELRKHADYDERDITVIDGTAASRKRQIQYSRIALINYAKLQYDIDHLLQRNYDYIVFDESHYLKNPAAKRTMAALKLAKQARHRYILTGTPIGKLETDIFTQATIVDRRIFGDSFLYFRARYFDEHYQTIWTKTKPKNGREGKAILRKIFNYTLKESRRDEFSRRIKLFSSRLVKEDCFNLPNKIYQVIGVPMSPQLSRAYNELEQNLTLKPLNLLSPEEKVERGGKLAKLRQMSGAGFYYDSNHNSEVIDTAKVDAVVEMIENMDEKKIVIWYHHDATRRILARALKDKSPAFIYGKQTQKIRTDELNRFRDDPKCCVIIIQEAAGATAITLTMSRVNMIVERGLSCTIRSQLQDRTHRIGAEVHQKGILYIDFITPDTVDEDILQLIENQMKAATLALDGDRDGGNINQGMIINKISKRRK